MEPIFERSGGLFVPTEHAVGPWSPDALHGGAPAALVQHVVASRGGAGEARDGGGGGGADHGGAGGGGEGMAVVRATYDFLGPVPVAPLEVAVTPLREGRRLALFGVTLSAGGREALYARVMLLRREPVDVGVTPSDEEPALATAPGEGHPPFPDDEDALFSATRTGFATSGMELAIAEGDFLPNGPAAVWFRFRRPVVDDAPATPLETAAAAADFTNGYGHELSWEDWLFANVDLSVHFWREPAGDWIGARGGTTHGPDGAATSRGTLFDATGAIATTAQSLFVTPR